MTFRSLLAHRAARPVALSAAILVAAGGTTAWKATAKTVTLSVDGRSTTRSLHAGTVRDVLAAAHLSVGAHDLLAPAPGTSVSDGSRIVLRRGREMNLVVDGTPRTVWVTATSVDEALGQIDVRLGGALLSADRSRQIPLKGFSLDIRTRKQVQVLVAGGRHLAVTNGLLASDALNAAGVRLRPTDKLSVPLTDPIHDGEVISLTRIDGRRMAQDVSIPFGTSRIPDSSMDKGTERIVRAGEVGIRHQTFVLSFVNGHLARRQLATNVQTVNPVTQIVAYGTRAVQTQSYASSSAGGLNWGALANCESGGNPRAVSSSGTYRGLYQFSMSTWQGVGGSGDPIDASPSEQTHRAQILYSRSGRGAWPVCGQYL